MHPSIEQLVSNNPGIKIEEDEHNVIITNPWNDESVKFIIPKKEDLNLLENIFFISEFVAIFHKDRIEFIYGPLPDDDPDIGRQFKMNYKGKSFFCEYATVSNTFELLAKYFREAKTESTTHYRNLRHYRDYYHKAYIFKEAHKYTKPINFFITGS